jgi:beta-hydroxylase
MHAALQELDDASTREDWHAPGPSRGTVIRPPRSVLHAATPALVSLEAGWEAMRDEALAMRDQTFPWGNPEIYVGDWRVGPFWSHGEPVRGRFRRGCPTTVSALERLAGSGRLATAGFSILHPGADLRPHVHFDDWALRIFLPLKLPSGDVGFAIHGQPVPLCEGKVFGWYPTARHRAWNRTDDDRIVLLIDLLRPDRPRDAMRERMIEVTGRHGSSRHRDAGFSAAVV